MASLLGLPVELRLEILFEVLRDKSRPAPPGPSEARFLNRCSVDRARGCLEAESRRVRFESKPFPDLVLPLLLASKQLGHETLEVLRSKRFHSRAPSPESYRLDVVYINNASPAPPSPPFSTIGSFYNITNPLPQATLFPTWLTAPPRETKHIDELHVQFRLFNCPDYMPKNADPAMFKSDSRRVGLVLVFYHLATCVAHPDPWATGRISVGRLVLDFLPAQEGSAVLPLGPMPSRGGRRTKDFFRPYLSHAERDENWNPPEPGLRAAAMMMGFFRSSMDIWFREEAWLKARSGRSGYVQKIGEVEYRLAGTVQKFTEAGGLRG